MQRWNFWVIYNVIIMQDIIKNLNEGDIIRDKKINYLFLSVLNDKLRIKCKILKSDFYLDSFNYFPITDNNFSFKNVFRWGISSRYNNFYTKSFSANFFERRKNFKNFSDVVILGSSPSNNYFRNIITFLPRIFLSMIKKLI